MKLISLLTVILLAGLQSIYAQSINLYRIEFTDKGPSSDRVGISECLSPKALERRERFNIHTDESDLPVSENYISTITSTGLRVITKSRWFNYVIVEADPGKISALDQFSFVHKVTRLRDKNELEQTVPGSKDFFRNESYAPHSGKFQKSLAANIYNYGAAANQINMLKGEFLHDKGFSGQGMTIAVLDAGFNSVDVMPAFDSLRTNGQIKGVYDFVNPGGNVYHTDISAHGTMVLSTMGAYIQGDMVGTAPKADYWLLRSEDAVSEYILEEYYWVSAAEYADSVGADIINSSLGYTVYDDTSYNHTYADMDGNTTYITIGADKAAEKGILVVNSAGNSGNNSWTYIGAPADGDSVFTIGAVDAFRNYASFSSKGPTSDGRIKPTVAAQGQLAAVYGPYGLGFGSGTSFSSPIMAGISACLWQSAPSMNNMQVIEAIKYTADRTLSPDTLTGWGIPDFAAAYGVLGSNELTDAGKDVALSVWPNPFTNKLQVRINADANIKSSTLELRICSIEGKCVHQESVTLNHFIDNTLQVKGIDSLPAGLYLLQITDGTHSFVERIQKF